MTATIFALASGQARAAVALMRVSGPDAGAVLDGLCRRPPPRRATLRRLRDAAGEVLDHALVVWMPGPGTYTGEDTAELSLHGGRAVIEDVAAALLRLGARPAQPGEFTRRAFLHGRLDLTAAEGIADLIDAETSAQRRQAMRQMEGELGALYAGWAERLRLALAQQEALIDFVTEDLPATEEAAMLDAIATLRAEIAAHLDDGRGGERLRDGLVFAVVGPPNVGKSSLVNRLAARDVAIVTPHPGTTRDVLEARVVLGDVPVTLLDTAGLRTATDPIEAAGVQRARARAATADLVLAVRSPDVAADEALEGPDGALAVGPAGAAVLPILNKADLTTGAGGAAWRAPGGAWDGGLVDGMVVSARTGAGLPELHAALAARARQLTAQAGPPALTRARHRAALSRAAEALAQAEDARLPELRAESLRAALHAIGGVTGAVDTEAVLDAVFGRFCIGK